MLKIEYVDINELKEYSNNAKLHPDEQIEQIKQSIKDFGMNDPIAIDKNNVIIEGHGRLIACRQLGIKQVPVIRLNELTEEQRKAYTLVHNKLTMNSDFDIDILQDELSNIIDFDMQLYGFDFDNLELDNAFDDNIGEKHNSLVDDFIVPPFSVLDTKQQYWIDRKKAWLDLGIKSGDGRDAGAFNGCAFGEKYGRKVMTGTSIFDPVLCEVMYKWFCPNNGSIYDCFAGGSVRGIVADKLGYKYTGIDLRKEQIEANYNNASELDCSNNLKWYCDDSLNADMYVKDNSVDFIFSCPPYADLEVYSDDPRDISNMNYNDFCETYKKIIDVACKKLKDDRFAVFVVGDIRDKKGAYRNFVDYTKECFNKNGLVTYNEAILLDIIGTAPLRARRTFNTRKLIKTHQNVLIFYKGDIKKIKDNYDEIEVGDLESYVSCSEVI
jgi:16S rRNA G966 N2-methylase RsmD